MTRSPPSMRASSSTRAVALSAVTLVRVAPRATWLPADFLELRNIQLNADPVGSLDCVSPEIIDRSYPQGTAARPRGYAILGSALQFAPPPDQARPLIS